MEKFNKERYREWCYKTQHYLPRELLDIGKMYPTLTLKDAQELYYNSVEEILEKYNVELLIDVEYGFGTGLIMARNLFENKLKEMFE